MSVITAFVQCHPLPTFFVLAIAFSWWPWPLYSAGLAPSPIVGFGPFLAALVVVPIAHGRASLVLLLRRMLQWRVALRWYAVALLLPIVVAGSAALLNILLGAQPSAAALTRWPGILTTFGLFLLIPGIAGTWEEPGFRGYALPRMQADRSALTASLLLGFVWAVWHLPLLLTGTIPLSDVVFLIACATNIQPSHHTHHKLRAFQFQVVPPAASLAETRDEWKYAAIRAKLIRSYWNGVFVVSIYAQ